MKNNKITLDKYYLQSKIWNKKPSNHEKRRIKAVLSVFPEDTNSILDAGCGNGALINSLGSKYYTVGIDKSIVALKHVNAASVCGDISTLPFPDQSFDMTLCSETLEHLPIDIYNKALSELQRVSKKYILISLPHNELLEKRFAKCGVCGTVFHTSRHLRTFTLKKLKKLFPRFKMVIHTYSNVDSKRYNKFLLWLKHTLGNGWWISPTSICPQCGNKTVFVSTRNLITMFCNFINRIVSNKYEDWFIGLYKKGLLS